MILREALEVLRVNGYNSSVYVAPCLTDTEKFFIFRKSGEEVVFNIKGNVITYHSKPLTVIETSYIKECILKHYNDNE